MRIFNRMLMYCLFYHAVSGEMWLKSVGQFVESFRMYQAFIYFHENNIEPKISLIFDKLFHELIKNDIAVVILRTDLPSTKMQSVAYRSTREGTVHIIIYDFFKYNNNVSDSKAKLENIIDLIVQMSPVSRRCRCLILTYDKDIDLTGIFLHILRYGWRKKFLDLTILNVKNVTSTIHYYNPFKEKYIVERLNKTVELFPDKLKDMNGYFLRLPAPNMALGIEAKKDQRNGRIEQLTGNTFPFIDILSDHLNFSLKFIDMTDINWEEWFLHIRENLEKKVIDMTSFPIAFNDDDQAQLERGIPIYYIKVIAITPIVPVIVDIAAYFKIIISVITVVIIFVLIELTIRFLKINYYRWTWINVFGLIFNAALPEKHLPKKTFERIFFISIVFASIVNLNLIFVNFMDVKLMHDSELFDDIEAFTKSNLKIEVLNSTYNLFLKGNSILSSLKSLSIGYEDCVDLLVKNNDRTCVYALEYALELFKNDMKLYEVAKISKFVFITMGTKYFYEKGSPYVEKFENIIRIILESGIPYSWKDIKKYRDLASSENVKAFEEDLLFKQLLIIIVIGFSVSILTFFVEYVVAFLQIKTQVKKVNYY